MFQRCRWSPERPIQVNVIHRKYIFAGKKDDNTIMGITIDSINEYIYTQTYGGELYRARFDGTSKETVLREGKILVCS